MLAATDTGAAWAIRDGPRPGTASVSAGAEASVPVLAGTASQLLLWLYGREELDSSSLPDGLAGRLRGLCATD